jgi:hypothetical protein
MCNKWIGVDERLPKLNQRVWVGHIDKPNTIDCVVKTLGNRAVESLGDITWLISLEYCVSDPEPTHWMPYIDGEPKPDPPEVE